MSESPPSSFKSTHAALRPGDYVSPGLAVILPDPAFPNMFPGDRRTNDWPYLRREIPHNWYCDRRAASIGFVTRDEASVLYNTALRFAGRPALEIGCWLGWSACHLALGGVNLDIIDPVLESPDFHQSVSASLRAAGVFDRVRLHPGLSPQLVHRLAGDGLRWPLVFIDGNHNAPGRRDDAIACAQYASDDALILFHDLASPDVAQGLDYLRDNGWNTLVYMTMQIMGVAWRGNAAPVEHIPDPAVNFPIPDHLHGYTISGMRNPLSSGNAGQTPAKVVAAPLPGGSYLVTFDRK